MTIKSHSLAGVVRELDCLENKFIYLHDLHTPTVVISY